MIDRERLQSAASGYPYLRGLLAVPVGALCIVAALGNWEWGPFRRAWVFLVAVLGLASVAAWILRYYNERYGRVTPSVRQRVKAAAAGVAGVAVMLGGSLLLRSRASWSLDLPVNAIAAAFGLLMLVYCVAVVGPRLHHVLIWGSLLAVGLLPVWHGGDPSNVGLVLAGVAFMVNGVFDHRLLVRLLGPPRTPALGSDHAGG